MSEKLFYIRSKRPSERRILVIYNTTGLLVGFRLHGMGWTNDLVVKVPEMLPMTTRDFEKKEEKYNIVIEPYGKPQNNNKKQQ